MNEYDRQRIQSCITQTERFLAKEMGYMEKHRNQERITEYKNHIAELKKMMEV